MDGLIQWGLEIVRWIQTFRNPVFDGFFLTVNFLGVEDFYTLFLTSFFWCLNKALGIRLGAVVVFSTYVNISLKDLFAAPRPYQVDSKLYAPLQTPGYGIPSGHAQITATFWGYLATQWKTRLWWIIAIAIPLFVGIGRMYLGDHFPQDVLLGWALGIVLVAGYVALEPRAGQWISDQSLTMQIALAIIVPLALFALHATGETAVSAGLLVGLFAGLAVEEKSVRFDVRAAWPKQIVKSGAGLAVLLALRFGLKAIFPEQVLFDVIRYTVMGAWVSLGAPWVFVAVKLSAREMPDKRPSGTRPEIISD